MHKKITDLLIRTASAFFWGSVFWAVFIFLPPVYFSCILGLILFWILLVEWKNLNGYTNHALLALTPIYPIAPFVMLIYLNQQTDYQCLLYYLFILVFAHDTGAYLVGITCGKHKIAPTISPQKSWEGLWGGYAFTLVGLQCLLWLFGLAISYVSFFAVATAVCALACIGDLFESWLKRKAHIKDTSTIMPGHGGFLDRFDSILSVTFFFFIFRSALASLLLP